MLRLKTTYFMTNPYRLAHLSDRSHAGRTKALLGDVDLRRVNLQDAVITGVFIKDANFCQAKMPNGSTGSCVGSAKQ